MISAEELDMICEEQAITRMAFNEAAARLDRRARRLEEVIAAGPPETSP